jgi:iron-sulfur cluster insertion protein
MKVTINKDTKPILEELLKSSGKEAIRIEKAGPGCGGITVNIKADNIKPEDDMVEDSGITIVADKSISFFFTSATIYHHNGIYGPILKLK